ncbi:MAG TPA: dienelactone hydrolase family protein [Polyangiaceae bacterium]|jgi:carboxymethylenebutenolidase
MGFVTETLTYGDGQHTGMLVMPERGARPLPSVLVIQEAWGLDAHIEDVARRFAQAGYAALAPDLYARGGVRPPPMTRERLAELQALMNAVPTFFADEKTRATELARLEEGKRARISETFGVMFSAVRALDAHVPALLAATRTLRDEHAATRGQKVGSVGYCMGGGLSALLACHDPELAVACIYYGSSPPAELVPRIACPVVGFYGGEDARINPGIAPFAEAMSRAGKRFESHVYPGAHHAFFNDNRPTYHVGASRDAFARTLEALRVNLVG